mmetsp:Transcript_24804/g.37589  ORF Transcript_24804/g.37589 Transcript_24804/m.37589 type:complete len:84 (+) Transcript_24804:93-344(+)
MYFGKFDITWFWIDDVGPLEYAAAKKIFNRMLEVGASHHADHGGRLSAKIHTMRHNNLHHTIAVAREFHQNSNALNYEAFLQT